MEHERWVRLMESQTLELTPDEIAIGWHFCGDWDGLLVGPDMPMEQDCCTCGTPIVAPPQQGESG